MNPLNDQETELNPVGLPEDFRLLSELPKGHHARIYVRTRGFDPSELAEEYHVGFSSEEPSGYVGRLVIPLRVPTAYFNEPANLLGSAANPDLWEIVGYQSRVLGNPDSDWPKYTTKQGIHKSQVVYGIDRVPFDDVSPAIVCENLTDVWHAGPGAVGILGKSISRSQCDTLRNLLPGRDIVVMLDPDATAGAEIAAERIRAALLSDHRRGRVGRVVVAHQPDCDPGDLRQLIWQAAHDALASDKRRHNPR